VKQTGLALAALEAEAEDLVESAVVTDLGHVIFDDIPPFEKRGSLLFV